MAQHIGAVNDSRADKAAIPPLVLSVLTRRLAFVIVMRLVIAETIDAYHFTLRRAAMVTLLDLDQ